MSESDREKCLLQRKVALEVIEKGFKVHGQVPRQVLYNFVHISHVDLINPFLKGHSLGVRLIVHFFFSLFFDCSESFCKDILLLFKRSYHMKKVCFVRLYSLSQLWQLLFNDFLLIRCILNHGKDSRRTSSANNHFRRLQHSCATLLLLLIFSSKCCSTSPRF